MQSRLFLFSNLIKSSLNLKLSKFVYMQHELNELNYTAGLYKPNELLTQHILILTAITGSVINTNIQVHGKRKRRTVSINTKLINANIWPALEKFTNELLPIMLDFKTPKWQKGNTTLSYTLRLRHKFTLFDDFDDLVEPIMYDSHRGIFLPLTLHFIFNRPASHSFNEHYLRSLRLPINLFRRAKRPAFDDAVSFT